MVQGHDARERWLRDGFVVLPGLLGPEDVFAARTELLDSYPRRGDEDPYRTLGELPFASPAANSLTVHPRLVELAECLLASNDLRLYAGESWVKHGGEAEYDQEHHRDNHSPLPPSTDPRFRQVEMFVLLTDVSQAEGPPAFVPNGATAGLPLRRVGFPRVSHPEVYEAEVLGVGQAGTVIAYSVETVHRATELAPRATRVTLHASFRSADVEWTSRHAWGDRSYGEGWVAFVQQLSYRQTLLLGFPPAGHPYWTTETISETGVRYPGLDLSIWEGARTDVR